MKHAKRDFIVLCIMIVVTVLFLFRSLMPKNHLLYRLTGEDNLNLQDIWNRPSDDPRYPSFENLPAKYFITVKGHIDPALMKRIALQIITTYIAKEESCEFDSDGDFVGFRKFVKQVEPDVQGNYQVKIPFDGMAHYYHSCRWATKVILFAAKNVLTGAKNTSHIIIADNLAFFTDNKWAASGPYPTVNVNCDQQLVCSYEKDDKYNYEFNNLARRHNYLFQINFYASKPDAHKLVKANNAVKPLSKTNAKDEK